MPSLAEDLRVSKSDLNEFKKTAVRVLNYIPDVIDDETEYQGYLICSQLLPEHEKGFVLSKRIYSLEMRQTLLKNSINSFKF